MMAGEILKPSLVGQADNHIFGLIISKTVKQFVF
jgi:hypothetical protein